MRFFYERVVSVKLILLLSVVSSAAFAYSSGPPPGRTGGFGEGTCSSCHEFDGGSGSFAIFGVPAQYNPGQTYSIRVELSQAGQRRWGFQLAARFQSDGTQAGTIQVTNSTNTQITRFLGISYLSHTFLGTMAGTPDGPVSWTFDWVAPSEASGTVQFNAAGNAANFDDTPDGDHIYTAQEVSAAPNVNCNFTLAPSAQSFLAIGGSGTVAVTAPPACSWTAASNVDWISITSGQSGSGSGIAAFNVSSNSDALPRAGSLLIAGLVVQIIQRGTNTTQQFDDVPISSPFFDYVNLFAAHRITSGCSANPPRYCPDATTLRGQMAVFIIRALMGDQFEFPQQPYFTDVLPSHPFFKYIQKMRELEITRGCSATEYCPDASVTRGQMGVFLIRGALGDQFPYSSTPYFSDVPAAHPFFPYIQKMRELGITGGCSATQYCLDNPTTRAQMATFIVRAFFSGL